MTPSKAPMERRRHPRIRSRLPLELRRGGTFEIIETIDLSCIGANCRIHRPLPEMTRLQIILSLPTGDDGAPVDLVSCDGVVVRSERRGDGDHRIAIFFDDIPDADKEKLARFIARQQPATAE